jgi:hypothetical protein
MFVLSLARKIPGWVGVCGIALLLTGVVHLVWFGAHSSLGAPEIINGQYVLDSRGRIMKVITEAEFVAIATTR